MRKIKEVDDLITPQLQKRVREVHPEACFWAINDHQPLADHKSTSAGELQRRLLLASVFTTILPSTMFRLAQDDLYDASAAAWTASRMVAGTEERLPDDPDVDARSLRMEIVY